MYIRFQGRKKNTRADSYLGIFQMAFELRDSNTLEEHYEKELFENIEWLKKNLKNPKELQNDEQDTRRRQGRGCSVSIRNC